MLSTDNIDDHFCESNETSSSEEAEESKEFDMDEPSINQWMKKTARNLLRRLLLCTPATNVILKQARRNPQSFEAQA